MKKRRILVVEDEPDILEAVQYSLTREGFDVEIARDGEAGLRQARARVPDLVLLDVMLPGLDGIEVCRVLKTEEATRAVPVIMVTAKSEESDIVLGLGLGADDYVPKPFSPRELVARVKAVLRRGGAAGETAAHQGERVVRDGIVVDIGRHEVLVGGEPVPFTATELRLLHLLASHPGRVFDRDQLLDRVIGGKAIVISRNIDVHVRAIRRKLGPYRDHLETVRGVGYRFRDRGSS